MSTKQTIIAVLIIALTACGLYALQYYRGEIVFVKGGFRDLPLTIGGWKGEVREFPQEVYKELREDDNMYRIYRDPAGHELGLYIGYYGTKRGGHPDHIPQGCYTGAGWGVVEDAPYPVTLDNGRTVTVHNFYAAKGDQSEQVLYWIQNYRGEVMWSGLTQNIEKMKNKLFNRRNDGAFIRINSLVTTTRDETLAFETEFLKELMPHLHAVWPVEKVKR